MAITTGNANGHVYLHASSDSASSDSSQYGAHILHPLIHTGDVAVTSIHTSWGDGQKPAVDFW
jgi:hypothetical protein